MSAPVLKPPLRRLPWPVAGPLPGFGISLGYTLLYLGLIVLIPLALVVLCTAELSPAGFLHEMRFGALRVTTPIGVHGLDGASDPLVGHGTSHNLAEEVFNALARR